MTECVRDIYVPLSNVDFLKHAPRSIYIRIHIYFAHILTETDSTHQTVIIWD